MAFSIEVNDCRSVCTISVAFLSPASSMKRLGAIKCTIIGLIGDSNDWKINFNRTIELRCRENLVKTVNLLIF